MTSTAGKNFEFVIPPSPVSGRKTRRLRTDEISKGSSALQGLLHLDSISTRRSSKLGDDNSLALTITTASSACPYEPGCDYDTTPDGNVPVPPHPTRNVKRAQQIFNEFDGSNANGDNKEMGVSGGGGSAGGKRKKMSAIESLLKDILCGCEVRLP
uniref:Uncharacterized protein n=1 Tax=Trieres chinensis TaxID=1514140 RepID=A0A7S1YZQ5_TRICV|mmetsp:Transcript_14303/g.29461  ORF Transcript_14303/g.29461 Transcript_14303/m.29461 type:complete len:156 (+) Transcript_14303:266-733(+)|eukprot:CAMPEP_0183307568 /NCGR_PEP_ID=MMETSP0160_2-20130417/18039_1 /TAXON_ID=2839 ORGANISM="Odontella Sinensis, Strain Grunow 1884" /NCGR_SAMPLE_ID=MMETSP0160_2 /ASSEMBLY_ACC=CAM_ASM_000250 /LENGTH=155 /DNA_ID=CAMNT_0025471177 /DNA_START=215 /DNA_END=682 /DNA_ORIENTATION=+